MNKTRGMNVSLEESVDKGLPKSPRRRDEVSKHILQIDMNPEAADETTRRKVEEEVNDLFRQLGKS
jgi:hypothetical protein